MAFALVTGGCGFIGRHLVTALLSRGDAVRVLDTAEPVGLPEAACHERGSILDPSDLARAMDRIDVVYHLAGIAHLWVPEKRAFDLLNRQGTVEVLRAAARAGIRRIVHCSTESILLPKQRAGTIDEAVAPPVTDMPGPYTRSKHLAEQAALAAARDGSPVVIVNPTVPIGPGDHNVTPPAAMLSLFLSGQSSFFLDCVLNLVDVRDVAEGMIRAGDRGTVGQRYILGGENLRLRVLLDRLAAISGRRMPERRIRPAIALAVAAGAELLADHVTRRMPVATREGVRLALRSAPFDSGKAQNELGHAPRPIEAALAEAVQWSAAARGRADQIPPEPLARVGNGSGGGGSGTGRPGGLGA